MTKGEPTYAHIVATLSSLHQTHEWFKARTWLSCRITVSCINCITHIDLFVIYLIIQGVAIFAIYCDITSPISSMRQSPLCQLYDGCNQSTTDQPDPTGINVQVMSTKCFIKTLKIQLQLYLVVSSTNLQALRMKANVETGGFWCGSWNENHLPLPWVCLRCFYFPIG